MNRSEPHRPDPSDPWRELGLEPGADEDSIQRAYRKWVRRYPPELAAERFSRIQDAYETLRSPGRLLADARGRPTATLARLFPVAGLELGAEPEPPPMAKDEFDDLMSFARRTVVVALLEAFAEE